MTEKLLLPMPCVNSSYLEQYQYVSLPLNRVNRRVCYTGVILAVTRGSND